ncbi:hypothetical protein [Rubripirellula reticaptiva]|uniref:hypothetical protein n=1 Tax=Rubripirellula reticaptiva TaxID=2528013 RepID=UPI001647FE1E|nr:hypothetical protein [Rubripirellula reticaptiva]
MSSPKVSQLQFQVCIPMGCLSLRRPNVDASHLAMVPPLSEMAFPASLDGMLELAEGKSQLDPNTERE